MIKKTIETKYVKIDSDVVKRIEHDAGDAEVTFAEGVRQILEKAYYPERYKDGSDRKESEGDN